VGVHRVRAVERARSREANVERFCLCDSDSHIASACAFRATSYTARQLRRLFAFAKLQPVGLRVDSTQSTGWRMKKLRMTSSTVESAGNVCHSSIQSVLFNAMPANSRLLWR